MPLRRAIADWGIPFGVAFMVVAFAAGSGVPPDLKRWALGRALGRADRSLRRGSRRRVPPAVADAHSAGAGLLAFGALAGSLSGSRRRVDGLVGHAAADVRARRLARIPLRARRGARARPRPTDTQARVRLFQGLGAGAIAVGLLGVGVLVFDFDAAAIRAGAGSPWRYRGFTENPNTTAVLAGASLPILVALAIRSTSTRRQAAWLAGALLMVGTLIASESRGGLLAGGRRDARRRSLRRDRS